MMKKGKRRKFGRTLQHLAFGRFREILTYKAEWAGKDIVKVDKWFPSSQLCYVCGYRNKGTKDLKVRSWTCPRCSTEHDRDVNATRNLALNYLFNTEATSGIHAGGDATSMFQLWLEGKWRRRNQKSCRTMDPTSPSL